MKHPFIAGFLGAVFYVGVTAVLAAAPVNGQVLTTSPDHPRTFFTSGREQVDHYVQWNADAGALEGHVTYGTPSLDANWWNPAYYDSFKVHFPNVRLDAQEGRLYVIDSRKHQVTIGHMQPGVFGQRVELERNVDLSMHRHDGRLDAALVAGP